MTVGQWEVKELGVRRKVHPPGEDLLVMEVQFDSGAVRSAHAHPNEQITYCISGSFEITVSEKTHLLSTGETLHIPSNALHSIKALEQGMLLNTYPAPKGDLFWHKVKNARTFHFIMKS